MRDNSPILQRLEMRQERNARNSTFARRPSRASDLSAGANPDRTLESVSPSAGQSSRVYLTERASNSKSVNLRFQQDSVCQKLLESKLDCAFRCAINDSENHIARNPPSTKKPLLTNSYLISDGYSPKAQPLSNTLPSDRFGCKRLDFSGFAQTTKPSRFGPTTASPLRERACQKSLFATESSLLPDEALQTQPKNCKQTVRARRLSLFAKMSVQRRLKIARELLLVLLKTKKCHLKRSDCSDRGLFPCESYSLPNSQKFFRCVAENNVERVAEMLAEQPLLVHQLDSVGSTVHADRPRGRCAARPLRHGRTAPRKEQLRRRR